MICRRPGRFVPAASGGKNGPMPPAALPLAVSLARRPTGPAFDLVLLAHVVAVAVSLGTVAVSGVQAARLSRLPAGTAAGSNLATYYAPGVNWVGRTLYAVPVLGFVLVGMSHGFFHLGDDWILAGIALWLVAAMVAEGLLWPNERRLQSLVHPGAVPEARAGGGAGGPTTVTLAAACRTVWLSAAGLVALLILATVLMVAQP